MESGRRYGRYGSHLNSQELGGTQTPVVGKAACATALPDIYR